MIYEKRRANPLWHEFFQTWTFKLYVNYAISRCHTVNGSPSNTFTQWKLVSINLSNSKTLIECLVLRLGFIELGFLIKCFKSYYVLKDDPYLLADPKDCVLLLDKFPLLMTLWAIRFGAKLQLWVGVVFLFQSNPVKSPQKFRRMLKISCH
jgi:hypothetical protein